MNITLRNYFFTLLAVVLIFTSACKKDKDDSPSILGAWVMEIGPDKNIPVQLSFFSNDFFEWVPLIPTENHNRSAAKYTFKDGVLKITNDPDCPEVGEYNVNIQGINMTLSLKNDDCDPRTAGLEGTWKRKDLMLDVRIQGIWEKSVTINDTIRQIIFYPQQNGIFEWLISKETPLYQTSSGRYAVGTEYLVVYNFLDCASILGYYTYSLSGENQIIISEEQDHCGFRITAIAGTWTKEPNF